jgi:hypothetical protein
MDRRYSRNLRALIAALLVAGTASAATTAEAQVLTLPQMRCVVVLRPSGEWYDEVCWSSTFFVCERY